MGVLIKIILYSVVFINRKDIPYFCINNIHTSISLTKSEL